MRFKNIASGSKGNATYIGNDHTHILIDAGVSKKKIVEGLRELDLTLEDLTAILITHEHSDHIRALDVIERAQSIPVYTTEGTLQALVGKGILDPDNQMVQVVRGEQPFQVLDIQVTPLTVSHDAREPVCYRLEDAGTERGNTSCAVVTDLGEYTPELIRRLQGLSILMLEANHDLRMLETGPYPYPLKRRIAGRQGHLCNEASGQMLSQLLHDHLNHVVLGHLSQKNNYRELARLTVEQEIEAWENPYHASDFPIQVADQELGSAVYCF